MDEQIIYEKLNEIFRNVFMDDEIVVKPETFSGDIEDWDSLMQMVLIKEVEKAFGFSFEAKEVNGMNNVGEMVEIIKKKGTV